MLPSICDSAAVVRDEPPLDIPRSAPRAAPREVQLPLLGTKRCSACQQRRAIKGGSQKGGRFVCCACRDLRAL